MGAAPCFGWLGEARHTLTSEALEASPARKLRPTAMQGEMLWPVGITLAPHFLRSTAALPRDRSAVGAEAEHGRERTARNGGVAIQGRRAPVGGRRRASCRLGIHTMSDDTRTAETPASRTPRNKGKLSRR